MPSTLVTRSSIIESAGSAFAIGRNRVMYRLAQTVEADGITYRYGIQDGGNGHGKLVRVSTIGTDKRQPTRDRVRIEFGRDAERADDSVIFDGTDGSITGRAECSEMIPAHLLAL